MATMQRRPVSAVFADLGLTPQATGTDLGTGTANETEEERKRRMRQQQGGSIGGTLGGIISPAVQDLFGGRMF